MKDMDGSLENDDVENTRQEMLFQLRKELVTHARAEHEWFVQAYHAMQQQGDSQHLLMCCASEHKIVDDLLRQLEKLEASANQSQVDSDDDEKTEEREPATMNN